MASHIIRGELWATMVQSLMCLSRVSERARGEKVQIIEAGSEIPGAACCGPKSVQPWEAPCRYSALP